MRKVRSQAELNGLGQWLEVLGGKGLRARGSETAGRAGKGGTVRGVNSRRSRMKFTNLF